MNNLFYADPQNGRHITWTEFLEDIKNRSEYRPFVLTSSTGEVFTQLVLSLLAGAEITLLDADFSKDELEALGITPELLKPEPLKLDPSTLKLLNPSTLKLFNFSTKEPANASTHKLVNFSTKEPANASAHKLVNASTLKLLNYSKDNWRITLYTSGTTGLPKKITHGFSSLTRAVKIAEDKRNDVWGFCYNPTHIAGLQVFFQALLNGNTIINLFRYGKRQIIEAVRNYNITHLSATPTFYRMLLPLETEFPQVRRITSGGERFDNRTMERIKKTFPNAKITNIYASTEAGTLLVSDGDLFRIKKEFADVLKIENGELLVHRSLTGMDGVEEWYATGDMVEIVRREPLRFRFKHRSDELLKIGGYKVDPQEVESVILRHGGVKNCRVYGKNNPVIGTVLLCDVVPSGERITESEILSWLKDKLQPFKIPRMITVVDEIELTRSGKVKR